MNWHGIMVTYRKYFMELEEENKMNRRKAIGGISAGLAAAMVAPALSVNAQTNQVADKLQDPKNKYPKPPFNSQSQPWPG